MVQAASISTSASAPAYHSPVPDSDPTVGAAPGSGADGMFGRLFRAQAASASTAGASGATITQGTAVDEAEAAKAKVGGGVEAGQGVAGVGEGKLSSAARAGFGADAVPENAFVAAQHDAEARKIGAVVRERDLGIAGEASAGEPARGEGVSGGNGKDKTLGKDKKDSVDSKHSGAVSTPVAPTPAAGFAAQAVAPASVSGGLPASSLRAAGAGSDAAQTASTSISSSSLHMALANKATASGTGTGSASGSEASTALENVSGIASETVLTAEVMAQSAGGPDTVPGVGPGTGFWKDAPTGKTPAMKAQAAVAAPSITAAGAPGVLKTALDAAQRGGRLTGAEAKAAGSTLRASTQIGVLPEAQAGTVMVSTVPAGSGPAAHSAAAPVASSGAGMTTMVSSSPYARMDQGVAPVVLHSGAQQVAVGMHDSSLGWVEIRAQNVSGHVDATLVAPSGQTQASLASQLPAMAQFVVQQDVRLGTLAVHQQVSGSAGGGFGGGMGHGGGAGQSGANPNGANPGGANPGSGFNQGGFTGGFGNPSGGSHSSSPRSSFISGRSVGGVPASGVSESRALYESGEDVGFGPVSYINVRA